MSNNEMSKAYDPKQVEERLYDWWEAQGYFAPKIDRKGDSANRPNKPFVISIPPPNITGELHHGHAMFVAFEDLLIRWHRMMGEPTLWVPGTDHAGIATQNVVEKALLKQGTSRRELGREEFVKRVWEWKAEYGGIITRQIRRLGASVDWKRERFTLDDGLSRAVREAFVRWYKKGLIYRGPRLVNWCPRDESAISDLEVEHEETQGKLYYVKYPIASSTSSSLRSDSAQNDSDLHAEPNGTESKNEYIIVATTRPETMLGDTAVAVHPKDARYKKLIGKFAILPPLGRRLPIIADESVDRAFGTGAVKVTPAHDPTDYELGTRHKLESINIMNPDATINANGGAYAGLDRYAAREKIVADLQARGLIEKIEEHTLSLGHCQRCDAVIEPLISTQWFVKTKPLAREALRAVRSGKIKIVPERFNKEFFRWMTDIRDWCISRQLWWGHRIPVWYCENGHETCETTDPTQCAVCGSTNIHQDEDVLDTWFSSGLWPFSTLGWPQDTDDLRYFYPTSVLETGYDILFFWVARMIMMGLDFTGKPPFHTVYLHGLMRHVDGSKMSKSDFRPGDNPLDVIRDYSSDALRFFIITSSSPGADVRMNLDKIAEARNFANKIWNAARFVVSNLMDRRSIERPDESANLSLADKWILSRTNAIIARVTKSMREWRFNDAGQELYHFLWDEFCDWYIEASKLALYGNDERAKQTTRAVLVHVLNQSLRLLHPMMPFVTEEIYQHLRQPDWEPALIIARWSHAGKTDARAEKDFARLMEAVRAIRNARSEYGIEPAKRIPALIVAGRRANLFESQRAVLSALARLDDAQLQIAAKQSAPVQALALHTNDVTIYLPFGGMLDVEKEKARLAKEIQDTQAQVTRSENLLASEFVKKAPAQVVAREREKLAAHRERLAQLEKQLAVLEGRAVESKGAGDKRKKTTRKTVKKKGKSIAKVVKGKKKVIRNK